MADHSRHWMLTAKPDSVVAAVKQLGEIAFHADGGMSAAEIARVASKTIAHQRDEYMSLFSMFMQTSDDSVEKVEFVIISHNDELADVLIERQVVRFDGSFHGSRKTEGSIPVPREFAQKLIEALNSFSWIYQTPYRKTRQAIPTSPT